jgi:hypothetical protein
MVFAHPSFNHAVSSIMPQRKSPTVLQRRDPRIHFCATDGLPARAPL